MKDNYTFASQKTFGTCTTVDTNKKHKLCDEAVQPLLFSP